MLFHRVTPVRLPARIGIDCARVQMVEDGKCNNDCMFARDGMCDDRRAMGACPDGTDCQDCGPWGQTNFTMVRDETDTHAQTGKTRLLPRKLLFLVAKTWFEFARQKLGADRTWAGQAAR